MRDKPSPLVERTPRPLWGVAAVPLVCICLLLLMEAVGVSARKFTPARGDHTIEIVVLRSNAELYRYWKKLGIKGRVVVHAGRYLHYVAAENVSGGYRATRVYPVVLQGVRQELESSVGYTNVLWVAVQANMARALFILMPPEVFDSRFASRSDYPERDKGIVRASDVDAARTIVTALPETRERVVLNMDASYLGGANGKYVLDRLLADAVKADVITVCLSEDNPDVRDTERKDALQLLERFATASPGRVKLVRSSEGVP